MVSLLLVAGLAALANASPSSLPFNLQPRAACAGNTADTRTQWCDFDINTDWYTTVPETGVTREYWLELTDVTVSPDGVSRVAMAVNGTIPGPTIFADWGDTVVVHVTNSLSTSNNGTSIHWHGIRQNFTNQNDGVVSITQCPTAVGRTTTYTWRAAQYGSTWYHSHFALQAWEGVFGGIVINGPASANYDEDLGVLFLNDWDHQTVDQLYSRAQTQGPPTLANGLLNGTNVFGEDGDETQTGSRLILSFTGGTSYRIRLVNAAIDTHWKFSIDNHTMTVIAADLIPVQPYAATVVNLGMGQRLDIIVTADQAAVASDFWIRAIPQVACSDNDSADNIRAVIHYGSSTGTPATSAYEYTDSCTDETPNLVPVVSKSVSSDATDVLETVTVGRQNNLFKWFLNSTTMLVEWEDPTLLQLANNATTWDASDAVVELPNANEWAYVIIQTALPIPHPIHLHGFDYFVIAQGSGTFSSNMTTLNLENPPRRDTAMLPASGFLVLAFETDNPGAWLMHCHIGWHTSEGFAMQFVVRRDEVLGLTDTTELSDTCEAWTSFAESAAVEQEDSGV